MISNYKYTFDLKEGKSTSVMKKQMPSQREQYGGTVHLFIGTGCSPDKITFVSLITNHNQNTNHQGLNGLLLFKSVLPFISRCCHAEAPWIVALACTFVLYHFTYHTTEGVFAWRTFGEEEGPQHTHW